MESGERAKQHVAERDLVLFLGAGFSWDACLPTMAEFGEASIKLQQNLPRHASAPFESRDFRHAAPQLMKARRTFEGFRALCRDSGVFPDADWNNIEDLFAVAEGLAQAGQREIVIDRQPYATSTVVRDLQFWIWKTYQQLPPLQRKSAAGRPVNKSPYNALLSLVQELELEERLVILTTNYDLLWEYFAFNHGILSTYPFEWPEGFRAGHGERHYALPASKGRGPVVCKLHGSVNFFWDEEGDVSQVWVASDLGDGIKIGKSGGKPFSNAPAVLAIDAIWNLQTRYGHGFVPAIIPPTYAKLQSRPWLTQIWRTALQALTQAKNIVFIGYSLPRADGFMSALITGAMTMRGRNLRGRTCSSLIRIPRHTGGSGGFLETSRKIAAQ